MYKFPRKYGESPIFTNKFYNFIKFYEHLTKNPGENRGIKHSKKTNKIGLLFILTATSYIRKNLNEVARCIRS